MGRQALKRKLLRVCTRLFCAGLLVLVFSPLGWAGQKVHTVYFEGQENELSVYRIFGKNPGKTLMIIGGIQGDEPGGLLAADYYVDISLEKGNLIVVPRANFPSILKMERQINQDMNRKFMDDRVSNYEARVVEVLKKLICESDCFVNLHEGSGFYRPVWVDENRNPQKYGQSIIVDDALLDQKHSARSTGQTDQVVDLEKMATQVIMRLNQRIENPDHFFHFNNHRTSDPDTLHKEQRGSATYYAMNVCQIPAFGLESAKSLSLEQKVRQHILGVDAFMELMDIVPKRPGIDLKTPQMQYMIISVNDSIPVVVENMQRLQLKKGDTIQVHDIVTNYERGLSVDVIGTGNQFNDMKKRLTIIESTRIVAKKDFYACGSVFLDVEDAPVATGVEDLTVSTRNEDAQLAYKVSVNGKIQMVDNYARLTITQGDRLVLVDLVGGTAGVDPSDYVVNFKGFVGNSSLNTGEDRGYPIDTGKPGVLMKRYALDEKGLQYYVVTTLGKKEVGKLFIDIQP